MRNCNCKTTGHEKGCPFWVGTELTIKEPGVVVMPGDPALLRAQLDAALLQIEELKKRLEARREQGDADIEVVREITAERDAALRLKDEAVQKGRDLCQGFGNLLLAVLRMNKHMKDQHELSTCCHGVSPSPAYELEQAYNALAPLVKEQQKDKRVVSSDYECLECSWYGPGKLYKPCKKHEGL